MTSLACVLCGHSWTYHNYYDDVEEHYVNVPCAYHDCGCRAFMDAEDKEE